MENNDRIIKGICNQMARDYGNYLCRMAGSISVINDWDKFIEDVTNEYIDRIPKEHFFKMKDMKYLETRKDIMSDAKRKQIFELALKLV